MCDSCATGDKTATPADDAVTVVYEVTGMTCGHCEGAVKSEIEQVDRVTGVTADAATGLVTVASRGPVAEDAVRAAVDEAGYTLTGTAG